MASSVKKTYRLITVLACLMHFSAGYTLVPGMLVPANTTIPTRPEIRTCIQRPACINIYLLALESLQTTSINDLLSHYRISGIHGDNFAWDGDTGGNYPNGFGYCYHTDRLFATWHRPYLSLYEKTLYDRATQIIQGFTNGAIKDQHLAELTTWRLPYWDWAMDARLPTVMGSTTASANVIVTKMQNGALRNVSIQNPLYSYRLQISNDPNLRIPRPPGQRSGTTVETVRSPVTRSGVYRTDVNRVNSLLSGSTTGWRESVVRTFSTITDYNSFSNWGDNGDSIEGVHGSVHVTVGNYGHMNYVELSSYDPIFYLHHANIDRFFAIWQIINPNSYLTNSTSASPNENTSLHPFRRTETEYWTSKSCRDTKVFGYTYPELLNGTREAAIIAFNNLYGATLPTSGKKRKRQVTSADGGTTTDEDEDNVDDSTDDILATYNDYAGHIKIGNTAAKMSFPVCLFLGEPSADPDNYESDPNCAGCFKVFTRTNLPKSRKKIVHGTITMTKALYNLYTTGKIPDMKRKTLKDYLKKNLQWRIRADQTEGLDLDGYEIDIAVAKVKIPNRKNLLPIWGKYSSIHKAR